MDLKNQLLYEHSRANCDLIIDWVGDKQDRFDELFDLFMSKEYRIGQRAAMPLRYCVFNHPILMEGKWALLIENLNEPNIHDALKRNTVSILAELEYPNEFMGIVADHCFNYLADIKEATAIRAYSMTVLYKIVLKEPELAHELYELITEHLPHASAGFKSRGKKTIKQLEKILAK